MPFYHEDDYIMKVAALGQSYSSCWNKTPPLTSSTPRQSLCTWPGSPPAVVLAGAALNAVAVTNVSHGGSLDHGSNVAPKTKHLLSLSSEFYCGAGFAPGHLELYDLLLYYPGIDLNSVLLQNFVNGVGLPRYATGAGVRAKLIVTAGLTAGGLPTATLLYTNQLGAPSAPRFLVSLRQSCNPGEVTNDKVPAAFSPSTRMAGDGCFPLGIGDTGIQTATSIQLSAGLGAGVTGALLLVKPLAAVSMFNSYPSPRLGQREFKNKTNCLPQIYDGAYLYQEYMWGSAPGNVDVTAKFFGSILTVWG